jgi:sulfur relay (sulfurtransferase) DsrC/TusE family protein
VDPDSFKKAPAVRHLVKTINKEGVSNFEWMSCACMAGLVVACRVKEMEPAVRHLVKTINEEVVSNFDWMSCACMAGLVVSGRVKGMAKFLKSLSINLTFVLEGM